jgi:hypothetical protein
MRRNYAAPGCNAAINFSAIGPKIGIISVEGGGVAEGATGHTAFICVQICDFSASSQFSPQAS